MKRSQYGFTLFELVFALVWLAAASAGVYFFVLVCRALLKFIGS